MKDILQKIRLPASPAEIAVADTVGAQLMALRPDSLRITLMHSEQREATYNLGKGAGLQGPAGTPAERFFTSDEVIGLVPFLLQENSNRRGYNIFITPFSASVWYLLLDDILPDKIAELAHLRLTPQVLIESSPQRFQGIYLLPRECATKDEANDLFRLINARHGDPKISGLIHPFRAVGFRNRKSKYRQPNGFCPFAGMVWGGKALPDGLIPLLNEVKSPTPVTPLKVRRQKQQIPGLDPATDASVDAETAAYAREHYRRLRWRYGRDYDRFKADFMLAERLLARQLTVDRVVAALVSFSPGIQERCGGKVSAVRRYVIKTLIKASATERSFKMTKSISTKMPSQETREGYIMGHLSKGMGFRFGYDFEFVNPYPEGPAGDAFTGGRYDCAWNDWDEILGGQKPCWWQPDWWESFWHL